MPRLNRALPPSLLAAMALRRPWGRAFLASPELEMSRLRRFALLRRFYAATLHVQSEHAMDEMIEVSAFVLGLPRSQKGCIVEAGAYKGGSAAKLSIVARESGRRLVVFDSFAGIPPNEEQHGRNLEGREAGFREGDYAGSLAEVKANVERYGEIGSCEFRQGWFEDTMPEFHEPVVAAYIDVDLASSTRSCLRFLYPLLVPGGCLFSQDGHLPLVCRLIEDAAFWEREVGVPKPPISGLWERKLVTIHKPDESGSAGTGGREGS